MTAALTTRVDDRGRATAQRLATYRLGITEPSAPAPRALEIAQSVVRIGAHAGNDVVLADDTVSRIHAEIVLEAAGFRLRDLGSTNGTTVDGLRVVDVYLPPTCTVRIGRCALEFRALGAVTEVALPEEERFGELVGRSAEMRALFGTLAQVAATDFTVLVRGESGTGKERVAEAIHAASPRRGGPLVVFDCAAIPASLVESELFGHEKGAFTGAVTRRVGCLEAADGGTLFLDEVGELPLELQPKLLRALERREVRPLGATEARRVDVRFVAATHRELAEAVNAGTFREDLYYRLAVVRVRVPPLRRRREDLPLLLRHLLERATRDGERARALEARLSDGDWIRLAAHPWPGNVRELRNVVERLVAFEGDLGRALDLGERVVGRSDAATSGGDRLAVPVELAFDEDWLEQRATIHDAIERAYFTAMLRRHGDNVTHAAEAAGLDRAYFRRLAKKWR